MSRIGLITPHWCALFNYFGASVTSWHVVLCGWGGQGQDRQTWRLDFGDWDVVGMPYPEIVCHVYIYIPRPRVYVCASESWWWSKILGCARDVAVTLDPSHAYEFGLEDQPGKEDTTQITIAVLMVFLFLIYLVTREIWILHAYALSQKGSFVPGI